MWEIYAYQNADSLFGIFNAAATIHGSGDYMAAVAAVAFCGFIAALVAYAFAPEKLQGWKWLATVLLVFSVLIVPRVTVGVVDKTGGSAVKVVANVPFGVAFLGSVTSTVGHTLTGLFETAFQVIPGVGALPSELSYEKNGLMFGNRLRSVMVRVSFLSARMVPFFRRLRLERVGSNRMDAADVRLRVHPGSARLAKQRRDHVGAGQGDNAKATLGLNCPTTALSASVSFFVPPVWALERTLSMHDNHRTLTQTGIGTPMGNLFRHFWLPALLSSELPCADCPPVRVRLLGEDLVAFRDSDNRVGVLDAYCPHRRAELYFGRNEQGGLRCIYHGWKFDVNGKCVDIPTEEDGCELAKSRPVAAYPVIERGGVVWVWMGPPEHQPPPPEFDFCTLPASHVYVSKCLMKCNYLQALEGSIDYSHISFLHKEAAGGADVFGIGDMIRFANDDGRPTIFTTPTAYGMWIAARRNAGDHAYFWRIARWLIPAFVVVPTEPGNVCRANAFIPIDDENCWWYRIRFHQDRPLTEAEILGYREGSFDYAELVPGTYMPRGSRENDYLQSRAKQRDGSFTGIPSAQLQDLAIQESQGRIHDRSLEKLVKSDFPLVQCRRTLLRLAGELGEGTIPAASANARLHRGQAYATTRPRDQTLEAILDDLGFE